MATGDDTRRSDPDATRLQGGPSEAEPRRFGAERPADRTQQIPATPAERTPPPDRGDTGDPASTQASVPVSDRREGGRLAAGERGPGYREKQAFRFDFLQVAAFATGVYLLVSGLVTLARSGFDSLGLFTPHLEVGGFHTTPLLAFIAIVVGLLLLAGGASDVNSAALRFGAVVIGVVGAVWIIEPDAFHQYLGVHRANGIQHLIIGIALLLASLIPPIDFRQGAR